MCTHELCTLNVLFQMVRVQFRWFRSDSRAVVDMWGSPSRSLALDCKQDAVCLSLYKRVFPKPLPPSPSPASSLVSVATSNAAQLEIQLLETKVAP